MSALDQARDTQLRNIEAKAGKTQAELSAIVVASGLAKHGEIRQMLMAKFGLAYGDANTLTHFALASDGQSAAEASGSTTDDLVGEIYSGAKAALRPIHDRFMAAVVGFGPFVIVPKKGYLSLRRKKQFAMIGPATKDKVEIGFNMKGIAGTERLIALPPGGMCQYKVRVGTAADVDAEVIGWARTAFDTAG